jgi:hypothetical protein
MSRRFHVDPGERVDIYEFEPDAMLSDAPPNVITIRARMDVATAGRVASELLQLGTDNKPELHVGAHVGALLLHNILAWRGPDFDDLPCTPANIRCLPSAQSDPFIAKVADAIGARNQPRGSPNPKPPTASGFGSAGGADSSADAPTDDGPRLSRPLATTTRRSPLRSALDGHRDRSVS